MAILANSSRFSDYLFDPSENRTDYKISCCKKVYYFVFYEGTICMVCHVIRLRFSIHGL